MKKFVRIALAVVVIGLVLFIVLRFYVVFGSGMNAGELNFVVYKGYIFKTYEGRMILPGLRSNVPGAIQSNEFNFSVTDPAIANKLMLASGKHVLLHYKQYFGTLPWRGYSKYIVDSIVSITEVGK